MAMLHYGQIPLGEKEKPLIERARKEIGKMAGPSRIFYAKRLVQRKECEGNLADAHVFFSISPRVEEEIKKATGLLAEKKCEFSVRVDSKLYSVARENGQELHFAYVDGANQVPKPVVLETQGHKISDTGIFRFHRLVNAIRGGEQLVEKVRELLLLIDEGIGLREGVAPFLSMDGENLCAPGQEMDEGKAAVVAGMIAKNGITGPNFTNFPFQAPRENVHFDFHGHPGYEGAWVIPPSGHDINRSLALMHDGDAQLCIQAVAIRLGMDDFGLFIRPFLRGEGEIAAVIGEIFVRIAYLDGIYNTNQSRKVGGEAYLLLNWLAGISNKFTENRELVEKLGSFGKLVENEPEEQAGLIVLWNELLELIDRIAGAKLIPKTDWEKQLWEMSGGALVESP